MLKDRCVGSVWDGSDQSQFHGKGAVQTWTDEDHTQGLQGGAGEGAKGCRWLVDDGS